MTAILSTLDPMLKRLMAGPMLSALRPAFPDLTTAEWKAWAADWRELVPITPEQERENAEWSSTVARANERLERLHEEYEAATTAIGDELGVRVGLREEDETAYVVVDDTPPHHSTYRTKDGAPPAPQQWKTIRFVRG